MVDVRRSTHLSTVQNPKTKLADGKSEACGGDRSTLRRDGGVLAVDELPGEVDGIDGRQARVQEPPVALGHRPGLKILVEEGEDEGGDEDPGALGRAAAAGGQGLPHEPAVVGGRVGDAGAGLGGVGLGGPAALADRDAHVVDAQLLHGGHDGVQLRVQEVGVA
jgi:hypothetical protein